MSGRFKRFAANAALSLVAIGVSLALLDGLLIVTGLFPPTYDYGDAKVGWLSARPTGAMVSEGCLELATQQRLEFRRNEDAIRTSRSSTELRQRDSTLRVAVSGDSHTDLCAPNERTHFGVLEQTLNASGRPTTVFAFGAGKYSPLQAYLAVQTPMREYHADALVLNVYTGNDFYDMLRVDDRPHFVPHDTGYSLADPVWYQQDPPGVVRRSRVLHALRLFGQRTGLRRVWLRITYLRDVASSQGQGLSAVTGYLNDLRHANADGVGYPQAFTAQMLNQQLFFHRFPGSRDESIRRMRALLAYVKQREPGRLLAVSPIPSYRMVDQSKSDSTFAAVLGRLPVTAEAGIAEERALYEALRTAAAAEGWAFVDNLPLLQAAAPTPALFNTFDYHIEPVASAIIGRAQAAVLDSALTARTGRGK
ncbi:MAG: hypothetical protein ACKVS7_03190 [Gemmatimonadaceae bacterium]